MSSIKNTMQTQAIQGQRWASIVQNVQQIAVPLGKSIEIVPAVKYGTAQEAAGLIQAGAKIIGENRVVDAEKRHVELSEMQLPPFETHFIGQLQRNKVKKALRLFSCIQSMDRNELFDEIQGECLKTGQKIEAMIQINTGDEAAKSGYTTEYIRQHHAPLFSFSNIQIVGIMAVTPYFQDPEEVRPLFHSAFRLFSELQPRYPNLVHLSMGMSNDYRVAIQEGTTTIRVGSVLYGR